MNYEKEGKGRPGRTRGRGIADRFFLAAIIVLVFAAPVFAQTTPAPSVASVPVGLQPLGIDIAYTQPVGGQSVDVAVANSGDNSVSILELNLNPNNFGGPKTLTPLTTLTGIPSPYGVAACGLNAFVVSSPSDNSVRVITVPGGNVAGVIEVGPQPHSVACFNDPSSGQMKGVVSNLGNNSLVVFDVATFAVTATIPGVPASRGYHGIAFVYQQPNGFVGPTIVEAWVAGTDANFLTIVNLSSATVVTQIPVSSPTATFTEPYMGVASAGSNEIVFYNTTTLAIISTIPNVPNPQDFVSNSSMGNFATEGGLNSLWWQNIITPASPANITGIPGAAALAQTSFGFAGAGVAAVLVTSTNSNSIFLIQAPPPSPNQFSFSNGASFATSQEAPGLLASAFVSTGASQIYNANSLPLPNTLGGVSLSVGGNLSFSATTGWTYSPTGSSQAGMLYVGPSQINFQIPPGIAPGSAVAAQLTKPDGTTLLTTLNITATAPGIFTLLQNGQGQGTVLNQDNSHDGNPQSIVGANPAARGSVIQIYATGAGATTPTLMPGEPAPASGNPLVLTNAQPTVTIGGVQAPVQFSGMAPGFVGLWQINAVVPQSVTPGNAVPLVISAGGATSNTVTIAVQ